MLFINRLLLVGLLSVGIGAATTAQAGSQLFTMEWFTKSFGNEIQGGTGASSIYTVFAIPHAAVQLSEPALSVRLDADGWSRHRPILPLGRHPGAGHATVQLHALEQPNPFSRRGRERAPGQGRHDFLINARRRERATDSAAIPESVVLHLAGRAQEDRMHREQHWCIPG